MRARENGIWTRENVLTLAPWDPTLLYYAKAVAKMMRRPLNDPRSWRYQAAVHGYDRNADPYATDADSLPSPAERRKYWSQCQHFSWFFLPWHRGYLAAFEQIVRAEIVALGGPEDWALPYWNYSDVTNPARARLIRAEFREPRLPDGDENALAGAVRGNNDEEEREGRETGDVGIDDDDVDLACLKTEAFDVPAESGISSFGGPRTGFNHNQGGVLGDLEGTPHGAIHVAVGGWMGSFETAALDPLFWLHHANVDRLWEVWLKRDTRFKNPIRKAWTVDVAFAMHDAQGRERTFTAGQMVDTTADGLAYVYEDVTDPVTSTAGLAQVTMGDPDRQAELVGTSEGSVPLGAGPTTGRVVIDARAAETAALGGESDQKVYLNLENVVGSDDTVNYRVFVNAPDPAAPDPENYAGLLTTFGLKQASSSAALHGGSGLTRVIDITELVSRLRVLGRWDDRELVVSFVPKRRAPKAADLKVGRISLFYR